MAINQTNIRREDKNMEEVIPIDMLHDLCSRFIINVPEEERKNVIRICFQIELAHWFYIDFYSKQKQTRRICNLEEFAAIVFRHVPFLHPFAENVAQIIGEWKEYKYSVPTYGAILLNEDLTHTLLVQSYCSKTSWGFPKGKINKGESPWQCAIREVLEETGFDIREHMDPTEFVEAVINDQTVRLYIIPGINMDQQFTPKTRNEIKSVSWFPLSDLPASKKEATTKLKTMSGSVSLFMVTPFVRKLREWIYENYGRSPKKNKSKRPRNKSCGDLDYLELKDLVSPTPDKKKLGKKDKNDVLLEDPEPTTNPEQLLQSPGHLESLISPSSNWVTVEANIKARRTLDYVLSQNPNIGSPAPIPHLDPPPNKKTPKKIRILKKADRPNEMPPSGQNLLNTLFPNKDLISPDSPKSPADSKKFPKSGKETTPLSTAKVRNSAESPQNKSFGGIQHDRTHSSFARVVHKGRNYFLSHSADHHRLTDKIDSSESMGLNMKFVPISFSKGFCECGVKTWSNFKFDRQDILKRMIG